MKKSLDRCQSTRVGTRADLVLLAKVKKTADIFFADEVLEVVSLLGKKTKEKFQISTVGGNGIARKPSLYGHVLEKKL